jgi:hypothetical protein
MHHDTPNARPNTHTHTHTHTYLLAAAELDTYTCRNSALLASNSRVKSTTFSSHLVIKGSPLVFPARSCPAVNKGVVQQGED